MKKIILILPLTFLFLLSESTAQITETEKSMSKGVHNSLVLELPGTSTKLVEKLWKKEAKSYGGKTKKDKKLGEWFTDNAEIVTIGGGNTVDMYSRVDEVGDDVVMTVWMDLGGAFLSSAEHPDQWNEAEKLCMRFALVVAKKQTEIELAAEEKQLKKFNSSLKKLKKDNERYHKEIAKAEETIAKMKANIAQNETDQTSTEEEVSAQKAVVEKVKQKLSDL